jgi:hypothetical protein
MCKILIRVPETTQTQEIKEENFPDLNDLICHMARIHQVSSEISRKHSQFQFILEEMNSRINFS